LGEADAFNAYHSSRSSPLPPPVSDRRSTRTQLLPLSSVTVAVLLPLPRRTAATSKLPAATAFGKAIEPLVPEVLRTVLWTRAGVDDEETEVGVAVGVLVAVGVFVGVLVDVGVLVGKFVGVLVGVFVGVLVIVGELVEDGVFVGVAVEPVLPPPNAPVPFGLPRPVGPSYPTLAVHKYDPLQLPVDPEITSNNAPGLAYAADAWLIDVAPANA